MSYIKLLLTYSLTGRAFLCSEVSSS